MLRFDHKQVYAVFDVETESLNLASSRPWQISMAILQGGKIISCKSDYIFWHDLNISEDAAKITNFNHSLYQKQAKDASEVLDYYGKYFNDENVLLVGHNILGFDVYQLKTWMQLVDKYQGWSFIDRCIDTLCLAKAIAFQVPVEKPLIYWQYKIYHKRFPRKGGSLSLGALAKKYNIYVDGAPLDENRLHEAEYDVKANAALFQKQLLEIEI